jgi:hypothetical protein
VRALLSSISLFLLIVIIPAKIQAQGFNQSFSINANCFTDGGRVGYCEACNFAYARPVFCQMNIQGQTSYGYSFQAVQRGWVFSGQCIRGQVYANNPYRDPLVFANAFVNCRF